MLRRAARGVAGGRPPSDSDVGVFGHFNGAGESPVGITSVIRAYESWLVRAYCIARFRIIRGRFLEEIGQFLPREGRVLEVGCGFGLFSLYYAVRFPRLEVDAFDLDEHRIDMARVAARNLAVRNARFSVADARDLDVDQVYDGIYLLDLVHHIPPDAARSLLALLVDRLAPGGALVVKDVDTRPRLKMAFTWLLDVAMTKGERPDYWSHQELTAYLEDLGLDVFRHTMTDSLPYPHLLYVAIKPPAEP